MTSLPKYGVLLTPQIWSKMQILKGYAEFESPLPTLRVIMNLPPRQITNLHVQRTFFVHFFAIVLHDYSAVLHDWNVKLLSYTLFFCSNYRMCSPNFCCLCSCSLLFFPYRSFSPCWPLAFLIFLPLLWNFHIFLLTKFVSFVFNHSL